MQAAMENLFLATSDPQGKDDSPTKTPKLAMDVKLKTMRKILPPPSAHWVGDGFHVKPIFASMAFTKEVTPFLMFDYAEPEHFPPTRKRLGVGQHPHRGFETVTIAFDGEVEHGDNQGNRGVIREGDVQWMTAAHGIIHEEYHSTEFAKRGGQFSMAQIWVNLPKKYKMVTPRYQELLNKDIPVVDLGDDCTVKIIAGQYGDNSGAAMTYSPINMWDVNLSAGRSVELPIPEGHNTIVMVRVGNIIAGEKKEKIQQSQVSLWSLAGNTLRVEALKKPASLLVLSGEPIDEPIAAQGPFVMNTYNEIRQANVDFRSGKMGQFF